MAQSAFLAKVTGVVQGVGYRFFAERKARRLNIKGYVRNLADGSVEVYAEGEEKNLESFLVELHKGPLGADVHNVQVQRREPTGKFEDFRITF